MSLLDDIQDGLTDAEVALINSERTLNFEDIQKALAMRCAVKAEALNNGIYLSDHSIDALTAALLKR